MHYILDYPQEFEDSGPDMPDFREKYLFFKQIEANVEAMQSVIQVGSVALNTGNEIYKMKIISSCICIFVPIVAESEAEKNYIFRRLVIDYVFLGLIGS